MKHLKNIITVLLLMSAHSLWASDQNYSNYSEIVSDLHNQLKVKKQDGPIKDLANSSYSLAAGLHTHLHTINDDSVTSFGIGGELGIYNFVPLPLKMGLIYASGNDIKEITTLLKTDHSVFKYSFLDLKIGLAAGFSFYNNVNTDFTSLFLSPSIAGLYQFHKNFDVSLNLEYLFHNSNKVSSHLNPSLNIVTYF